MPQAVSILKSFKVDRIGPKNPACKGDGINA